MAAGVTLTPSATGGISSSRTVSAATTNATNVKTSGGTVYGFLASNINAAVRYLKLYDKASAPTVGTDTPVATVVLPIGGTSSHSFPHGISFTNGISFALTTGIADSDTAAVSANEHVVHLFYK
jgi:hypothetical protein